MSNLILGESNKISIPVKVNSDGALSISDISGNQAFNGIFGERFVSHRLPKISANFCYPPDARSSTQTTLNGGSVSLVDSQLTLQTGVDVAGFASIQTNDYLRYSAGRDAEAMFTRIFTLGEMDSFDYGGLFDLNDGFFLGMDNEDFIIGVRRLASDILVKQSDFNRDKLDGNGPSRFVLDITKMNIFRINYGYLGIAPCYYQIFGGSEKGWITFHVHDVVNKQAMTHISNPYLPLRIEVANSGNNTNIIAKVGSVYAGTIDGAGSVDSSSREFSRSQSFAGVTAGTNKPLIFFHNQPTFGGVANKIDDLLIKIGFAVEGTKTVRISLYKINEEPVGGVWTDADTANSNMRINIGGAFTLTDANSMLLDAWALGKSDSLFEQVKQLNYLLRPNEYVVFTYTSTGTSDVEFVNRWSELF